MSYVLPVDQIDHLVTELERQQTDGGAWVPDGNPDWSLVLTAIAVKALCAFGAKNRPWFAPSATSGTGGTKAAIDHLKQSLANAGPGKVPGADAWDLCQAILALIAAGQDGKECRMHAEWLLRIWERLSNPTNHQHNRWHGPAFPAAILQVLLHYQRTLKTRQAIDDIRTFLRKQFEQRAGDKACPFPASARTSLENENRWNCGLTLRAIAEDIAANQTGDMPILEKTVEWLLGEVVNFDSWVGAREAEGTMFLSRTLEGLVASRPLVKQKVRQRIDRAVEEAKVRFDYALLAGLPNLKSKGAMLEFWGCCATFNGTDRQRKLLEPKMPMMTKARLAKIDAELQLWGDAHASIAHYVKNKPPPRAGKLWYDDFWDQRRLHDAGLYPKLPPLAHVFDPKARLAKSLIPTEYKFDRITKRWHFSADLLLAFGRGVESEPNRNTLARLFFFHEYLHVHHGITEGLYQRVGSFPNSLEYLDYVADVYALLHEQDLQLGLDPKKKDDDDALKRQLLDGIDLVIRSFWGFEQRGTTSWPVRRLRRHFNWYWRQAQIRRANSYESCLGYLARKPSVEIAGLALTTVGQQIVAHIDKRDPSKALELAIVSEDDRMVRLASGDAPDLSQLFLHIEQNDHRELQTLFAAIADKVSQAPEV